MSDDLVILKRYGTTVEAHIDCELLRAEGLHAVVTESAGFDPSLNEALSTLLRVAESDRHRAREVLQAAGPIDDNPLPNEPGEQVVRCPRCELEYCYFGRKRGGVVGIIAALAHFTSPKAWRCTKCGHVWHEEEEGHFVPSQFVADDPRPTFLLKRARPGMGLFLGAVLAWLVVIVSEPSETAMLFVAGALLGWLLGRAYVTYVCSTSDCRARLRKSDEICPGCKRTLAGSVDTAAEHYAAVADVRRELAALRRSVP